MGGETSAQIRITSKADRCRSGFSNSIFTYDLDSTGTFTSGSSKKDALLPLADPSLSSDSPFRHRSSAPRPTRNHHLASYIRQPLSHPALTVETFYPRLALSRDGEYLASGSSSGKVLLWDTRPLLSSRGADANIPTVLGGHSLETSSVDWGYDSVSHLARHNCTPQSIILIANATLAALRQRRFISPGMEKGSGTGARMPRRRAR